MFWVGWLDRLPLFLGLLPRSLSGALLSSICATAFAKNDGLFYTGLLSLIWLVRLRVLWPLTLSQPPVLGAGSGKAIPDSLCYDVGDYLSPEPGLRFLSRTSFWGSFLNFLVNALCIICDFGEGSGDTLAEIEIWLLVNVLPLELCFYVLLTCSVTDKNFLQSRVELVDYFGDDSWPTVGMVCFIDY